MKSISYDKTRSILRIHGIKNFTIQRNGLVDVDGDVDLRCRDFSRMPINFGKVNGDFHCGWCENLLTLDGTPNIIVGNFICNDCKFESIDFMPSKICGDLILGASNKSNSLIGIGSIDIRRFLFCDFSSIISGGIGLILTGCKFPYYCAPSNKDSNPFAIIAKYAGRPDDIFECQAELIEANFSEYAIM